MSNAVPGSSRRNRTMSRTASFATITVISPRNSATSRIDPENCALSRSTTKRGGAGSMYGPSTSCSPAVSIPVEGATPPAVQEARQEHADEHRHLDEAVKTQIAEDGRPGVQERRLDVEQDEQHRHHIEADGVALAGRLDGIHTAFVGTEVRAALPGIAEPCRKTEEGARKHRGGDELKADRHVVDHALSSGNPGARNFVMFFTSTGPRRRVVARKEGVMLAPRFPRCQRGRPAGVGGDRSDG